MFAIAWAALVAVAAALRAQGAEPPAGGDVFRFRDRTAAAGLAEPLRGAFPHAIAWGDIDRDGRLDVFIGTFGDRSPRYGMPRVPSHMLLRQRTDGTFEPMAAPAIERPSRCSGGALVDLDNDGDLDLYVCNNKLLVPTRPEPRRSIQFQGNRLYRNDGGTFVDVSARSGACPDDLWRCRDVGVFDFDGDGWLDLLVLQDCGTDPLDKPVGVRLFRNLGDLTFQDVTRAAGLPTDTVWGTGLAVADLNDDGRPDFFVCGSNRLYLSQGAAAYREAETLRDVLAAPQKELDWVTGAALGDLDGDGDFDLATGRHHYYGPSRIHVFLNGGLRDGLLRFANPPVRDVDILLDERGIVHNTAPPSGRAMIYYVNSPAVDYDGDGRLDLLATNWPEEGSRLFRNETPAGNWLQVQVQGTRMNRMGIGALVRVYDAGRAAQPAALRGTQEITVNGGYSSARCAVAHFGLGDAKSCDVEVTFPMRREPLVLRDVAVNRRLLVREPP